MRVFVASLAAATLVALIDLAAPVEALAQAGPAPSAAPAKTAGNTGSTGKTAPARHRQGRRQEDHRRLRPHARAAPDPRAVPYSRTLYYNDKGRERGITAELVRDFEQWINKKYAKKLGKRPITVYVSPTTRDDSSTTWPRASATSPPATSRSRPSASRNLDFYAPQDLAATKEVLVTGPTAPALGVLDDLAGKTVHVRPSSSYHESLVALNQKLKAAGRRLVHIVALPDALEDEDVMEMINAGILAVSVVDEWKGRIWAQILPKLRLRGDLVLRDDARIGWAFRKNSPKLRAELEDFFVNHAKKQDVMAYRLKRQMQNVKQLKDPTQSAEYKRYADTIALFRKYGRSTASTR